MSSGSEVRMESSKVHLLMQLLITAVGLLRTEVVEPDKPEHRSTRRPSKPATRSNGNDVENHRSGVVVPLPLVRSPIDPVEKYDLQFVSDHLKLSPQTLRKRIREGTLEAKREGKGRGCFMVTGEEILKHRNATRNATTEGDDE